MTLPSNDNSPLNSISDPIHGFEPLQFARKLVFHVFCSIQLADTSKFSRGIFCRGAEVFLLFSDYNEITDRYNNEKIALCHPTRPANQNH